MDISIYHNPKCSKSRKTLELLQAKGIEPTIIEYLQSPPDIKTLTEILQALKMGPLDLMRTGEDEYRMAKNTLQEMSKEELIEWLCDNPKVIERPIVVVGNRARIGRPPESVLEIIA
jgi:arsenate reductase